MQIRILENTIKGVDVELFYIPVITENVIYLDILHTLYILCAYSFKIFQ